MNGKRFAPITRTGALIVSALTIFGLIALAFTQTSLHLLPLVMNPFAVISLVTVVLNLALLVYFVGKPARTQERTWLTLYLAIVTLYAACELMERLSSTPQGALFWLYVSTPIVLMPAATFLFALSYTSQSERRYVGTEVILLVAANLLGFFYAYTNLVFVSDPKLALAMPWGYDFRKAIGPGVAFSLLWNDMLLILALSRLISFRRHNRSSVLRRQSLLFIFAVSLPLVAGTITNLILPIAGFVNVIPLGPVLAIPTGILLVYGLIRYQLLNVNPALFSHTILNIVQEAVVVTDRQLTVAYLNPKAETMLGIKPESSVSTSLLKVLQRTSGEALGTALQDVMSKGVMTADIDHIDLRPVHASPVPVRITASRLSLSDMNLWVWAMADITKELQTRSVIEHEVQVRTKELQEARAYLLSSINSLGQGFILLNAKLGVEVINRAAQAVFNVKQADAANLTIDEFAKNISWDVDLSKAIQRVLETKRYCKLDAASEQGSFFQLFLSPVLLDDHILGVAFIIQDVTEQRILDRSKDEFFSIASHELRTPLTAIRGNMSMVREYFPDALKDEGLASMITDTHDASVRLIAIVNDFLDSSRLEQGKMQFDIQPTALEPVVESVEKELGMLLERQENTITVEGLSKLPKAMADAGRLHQVIYNLLSNAVKYSQKTTITISGDADEHKVTLRVIDNGKGISPENQKLLFHKFQQAGDTLTRDDTKGTGLGLYISRLLAKNMHGNVELESSVEGKGSTFVLTLPRANTK